MMRLRLIRAHIFSAVLMTFAIYTVSIQDAQAAATNPTSSELKKARRNHKNLRGSESSETFVMSEPSFRQEVLAEERENVLIDCHLNKTRVQSCEWYKASSHGGNAKHISQFFDRYQRITPCQLQIRSVTYEDAGTIVCRATTDTTVFNFTSQLTVTGPDDPFGNILPKASADNSKVQQPYAEPEIVKELLPEDRVHRAHKGENILLKCEASGNPKPLVSWRRGSKNYTDLTEGYSYLRLKNITKDDAGAYKCEAVNIFGRVSTEVVLEMTGILQGASEILDVTPKNITLYEGTQGNLTCIARFEENPWFVWVKKLENNTKGNNTFTYEGHVYSVLPKTDIRPLGQHLFATTLLLQNVTLSNAGIYHCIVAGLQGYNHSEAFVTVEKDPSKLHEAQNRRHKAVAILWIFSFFIFAAFVILCIVRIYGCPTASKKKPNSQTSLPSESTTKKTELLKGSPATLSTDCTHLRHEVFSPLVPHHGHCTLTSQELSALLKQECGSACRTYYEPEYSGSSVIADLEAERSSGYHRPGSSCDSEYCSQLSVTSPSEFYQQLQWSSGRSQRPVRYHNQVSHHPQHSISHPHHQYLVPHHHVARSPSMREYSQSPLVPSVTPCSCLENHNEQNSQVSLVYVV